jgi:hypothetical protein
VVSKNTTVELKWYGKEVGEAAAKTMKSNATRVGMFLSGEVVKLLSVGQPAKRVGKRLVGLDPSKPGDPPHLLHGHLRNSIDHRIDRDRKHIDIYIGANTPYARALELGNPKARGNVMSSKNITSLASAKKKHGVGMPRPYLRPALKKNREKAIRMLVRNIFKGTNVGRSK